jgi:hypothetical protein
MSFIECLCVLEDTETSRSRSLLLQGVCRVTVDEIVVQQLEVGTHGPEERLGEERVFGGRPEAKLAGVELPQKVPQNTKV